MKRLLLGLLFALTLNAVPFLAYADEDMPDISAIDEPAIPALDTDASMSSDTTE